MSWTKNILAYLGMVRPYDFPRAIVALLVTMAFFFVVVLAVYWWAKESLFFNSPRIYFLSYLMALLGVSLLTISWTKISVLCLLVAYLELGLLFGSYALYELGGATTLLVPSAREIGSRFVYHPTLMATPKKNWTSKSGLDIRHNSYGIRGSEIGNIEGKVLIHTYGGSTTYDIGVPNGSTWPEVLQNSLGETVIVANLGVPGYSSAEHIVQTAFYSDLLGKQPKCSVYYIGWNDIRNSHIPKLDSGYADFHLLSQLTSLSVRPNSPMTFISPALFLLQRVTPIRDWVPEPPDYRREEPSDILIDLNLEKIYASNIRTLVALNNSRGIKTIFVAQVLNLARLTEERVYGGVPLVRDRDVWPIQEHFNNLLAREASKLGVSFFQHDIMRFSDSDFVDNGHFSIFGSKKFANFLAPKIKEDCIN